MRVIIAGSRNVLESDVLDAIQKCHWRGFISTVISGGARGADMFGEQWAAANNVPVTRYLAKWDSLGKAAGPVRNGEMAQVAHGLIAVWDGESRGTESMIDLAKEKGLRVFVYLTKTKEAIGRKALGEYGAAWEAVEERAAIKEYSADIPRHLAEASAAREFTGRLGAEVFLPKRSAGELI